MDKKKIVMFDFDGVLVNTLDFSYKIHKINNKDFTWERFQDFSNGNFHEGFQRVLDEENFILIDDFYGHYKKELDLLSIQDIICSTIRDLASKYTLVIISSTTSHVIKEFIEKENLSSYFDDILGHDVHISKVLKIKKVLEKYKVDPKDSVFITDTLGDIKEAGECNIASIAVTWGLHPRRTLEKGKPAFIIEDPMYLIETVKKVLK